MESSVDLASIGATQRDKAITRVVAGNDYLHVRDSVVETDEDWRRHEVLRLAEHARRTVRRALQLNELRVPLDLPR